MKKHSDKELWHHYDEYDIWVSNLGDVQSEDGSSFSRHLVNGDLRVNVKYTSGYRSFSVKRLVADAFIEKPFVGNTGLIELVNGDPFDCRAANLIWKRREQKDRGAFKEPGVSFNKGTGRWKAYVVINRAVCYVGYYMEKRGAVAARDKAYAMIRDGIPMEKIRDDLREVTDYLPAPREKPKTPHAKPIKDEQNRGSWRDWPESKKILAAGE